METTCFPTGRFMAAACEEKIYEYVDKKCLPFDI